MSSYPSYIYVPGRKTVNGDPVFEGDPRDCSNFNAEPWLYYDAPFTSMCFHRYAPDGSTLPPPPTPYFLHGMVANALGETVEGYMHFPAGTTPYDNYLNPALMRYINPADLVTPQALAAKAKWEAANGAVAPTAASVVSAATASSAVHAAPAITTAEKVATEAVTSSTPPPSGQSIWDRLANTFTGDGGGTATVMPASGLSTIPTWAWVAGGAAILFFMSGRSK